MKPTEHQKKVIKWIQDQLQTWIDTNDINSPTLFNDLHDFIEADLDAQTETWRECLEDYLGDILNLIRAV